MDIDTILNMADRQNAFFLLTERYVNDGLEFRTFVQNGWDFGVQWEYPNPSRLACHKHEKYSCAERIKASLIYEAISFHNQQDIRDHLVAWVVIYQSGCLVGIDSDEIFKQVAQLAPNDLALSLNAFIARKSEDKSVEAFMLKKHINAEGEIEILLPGQG